MLIEHIDTFHTISQMSKTFTTEGLSCCGPNYVF